MAQNPVYRQPAKQVKATVQILAVSSSLHQGYAGNQDVYIASIVGKHQEPQTVRLVDRYPAYDDGIRPNLLSNRSAFSMLLLRDEGCDTEPRFVHLVADRVFDPHLSSALLLQNGATLPCFVIKHEATRIALSGRNH